MWCRAPPASLLQARPPISAHPSGTPTRPTAARVPQSAAGSRTPRFQTVDALRGLAAAAVVWFHLTRMEFRLLPDGPLKASGTYGWLGVDMFFVISGFVLPWSLQRAGYTPRSFGRFVARRVVRLDPPYLASVLLVLAIAAAAPLLPAGSTRTPITAMQVALHLGYANVFAGERWLNPVYWTLAIEVQWYLLIGLALPLVAAREAHRRRLAIAALCVAALLPDLPNAPLRSLIFPFLGFFVMGIAAFLRRARLTTRREALVVLLAGLVLAAARVGPIAGVVGGCAALVIAEVDMAPRPLLWLGELSYSLYLVHSPVCTPFLRYAVVHQLPLPGRIAMMIAGGTASLAAAWVLARTVEVPARALAGRIRYARPLTLERTIGSLTAGSMRAVGRARATPVAIPRASER